MFKNRLQECGGNVQKQVTRVHPEDFFAFATTVNEGQDHLPEFKCSVTVNSARYDLPPGFKYKKEAENAAGCDSPPGFKYKKEVETRQDYSRMCSGGYSRMCSGSCCKKEHSTSYLSIYKEGIAHCATFKATVEINGELYTGAPGNNKEEAARNAAYEAIRSIHTQDCDSFPQIELHDETKQNNDSKQEFKVTNAVSKLPTDKVHLIINYW
eukprot:PITA_32021